MLFGLRQTRLLPTRELILLAFLIESTQSTARERLHRGAHIQRDRGRVIADRAAKFRGASGVRALSQKRLPTQAAHEASKDRLLRVACGARDHQRSASARAATTCRALSIDSLKLRERRKKRNLDLHLELCVLTPQLLKTLSGTSIRLGDAGHRLLLEFKPPRSQLTNAHPQRPPQLPPWASRSTPSDAPLRA